MADVVSFMNPDIKDFTACVKIGLRMRIMMKSPIASRCVPSQESYPELG